METLFGGIQFKSPVGGTHTYFPKQKRRKLAMAYVTTSIHGILGTSHGPRYSSRVWFLSSIGLMKLGNKVPWLRRKRKQICSPELSPKKEKRR